MPQGAIAAYPLVTPPGRCRHLTVLLLARQGGQVVIYLPGQRQAQDGWLGAQACPGLHGGGVLSPGTIQPGAPTIEDR
jgi:hypothetical protein